MVDARQKKEADEKLERWQREMDAAIKKHIEEGEAIVKEEMRKENVKRLLKRAEEMENMGRRLETIGRDYRHVLEEGERLRANIMALATQLGEKAAMLEILKKKKEELEHDWEGKRAVHAAARPPR